MPESSADMTAVVNRIKRAQGQLGGVLRMFEEGRDVESIVHQLKAVSSALDRAGFAMLVAELKGLLPADSGIAEDDLATLEKLFLSLT